MHRAAEVDDSRYRVRLKKLISHRDTELTIFEFQGHGEKIHSATTNRPHFRYRAPF